MKYKVRITIKSYELSKKNFMCLILNKMEQYIYTREHWTTRLQHKSNMTLNLKSDTPGIN